MERKLSRRDFLKLTGAITVGGILSACVPKSSPTTASFPTGVPTPTVIPGPTGTQTPIAIPLPRGGYPKIGWMYANYDHPTEHPGPPTSQQVARYDLVVENGLFNFLGDQNMEPVRRLNPRFIGLKADNTVYIPPSDPILTASGFSENYLLHFLDTSNEICGSSSRVTFPNWAWPIYIWNFANPDAVSFRASYEVNNFRSLQSIHPDFYNGLYLDGTQLAPEWYNWYPGRTFDVDCNGVSDPHDSVSYVSLEWKKGVIDYLRSIRNALPDIIIMCNDAIMYPDTFPELSPLINGVESEGGIDYYLDHYPVMDWQQGLAIPLQYWSQEGLEPRVSFAILHYSSTPIPTDQADQAMIVKGGQAYQRMRFGLTTSLMLGTYYQYEFSSYYNAQNRYWYDEYDNAGTQQPGYLGNPIGHAFQVGSIPTPDLSQDWLVPGTGVYRRNFQNGIALCNTTGAITTVILGGTFYRIRGTQDPIINDGHSTTQVTLNPLDGIILLNEPTP